MCISIDYAGLLLREGGGADASILDLIQHCYNPAPLPHPLPHPPGLPRPLPPPPPRADHCRLQGDQLGNHWQIFKF